MDQRPPSSAYAAALGMTVVFGLSFVATKYALRGFQPLALASLRFALAGALLWTIWRLRPRRERVTRQDLARLAALGFVSLTLYFSLEISGLARTSASAASVLIATIPIFSAVLAALFLGERGGARRWAGIGLSVAGVTGLVVAGSDAAGGGELVGNLLVLAASFTAGVYTLMARRLMVTRSALYVTAHQHLFGALFTLPIALVEALIHGLKTPTAQSLGGLAYVVCVASLVGYVLLNYAFRFFEASRVAVFVNLTPVVAVTAAFLLLGERLTGGQAVAAVVVVLGVWVANSGSAANRATEAS